MIGDYLNRIITRFRTYEKGVAEEAAKLLREQKIEAGVDPAKAYEEVEKEAAWRLLEGQNATEADKHLQRELRKIAKWRGHGPDATPPRTPYLDRLCAMCKKAEADLGMSESLCIDIIRSYAERNEFAHGDIPCIDNVVREDKSIDWTGLDVLLKLQVIKAEKKHLDGGLTEKNLNLFKSAIQVYRKMYIKESSGPLSIPTEWAAKSANEELKKAKNAKEKKKRTRRFPSPYFEGKWAGIEGHIPPL